VKSQSTNKAKIKNKYKDFTKMADKEKEEMYLNMREENNELKKKHCHLEKMINQVNGQFKAMNRKNNDV
jgi:ribosomal protein S2